MIIILHMMDPQTPLPRLLAEPLERALASSPVVVLTGARQTGKTTLCTMVRPRPGRRYLTLDDLDTLALAERDPESLLASADALVLDEVQRAPALLPAVKRAVDRARHPGRFLLTGSANLLLMRQVSESLAGRAVYLELGPMTASEIRGRPDPGPWTDLLASSDVRAAATTIDGRADQGVKWRSLAQRGGLPVAALDDDAEARARWLDGYVRTYLERDLRQHAAIEAIADFRRLLGLAALRTGSLVNHTSLARDVGLSQPTVARHLNLLEVSYLLHRLHPYSVNRGKRLIRTPKLYWLDSGLAAFLARFRPESRDPSDEPIAAALLENLVLTHLSAWRELRTPKPEVLFWRTASGQEVDFVIEDGRRLLPIEVKATRTVSPSDIRRLEAFLADHGRRAPFGLLIYDGADVRPVGARVIAVPLSRVL
jgi:hypothetical protein